MNDKNGTNKAMIYSSLGIMAISLLLTGIFIDKIFLLFSITLAPAITMVFRIIFIASAIFDFWLIKYVKDKL